APGVRQAGAPPRLLRRGGLAGAAVRLATPGRARARRPSGRGTRCADAGCARRLGRMSRGEAGPRKSRDLRFRIDAAMMFLGENVREVEWLRRILAWRRTALVIRVAGTPRTPGAIEQG